MAAALAVTSVWAQNADLNVCADGNRGGYGPFDYINPVHRTENLPIVERFHFDNDVFALRRGMLSDHMGGDLDYTLRAFPNHHRALDAASRLSIRDKTNKPRGMRCTIEGWFERAIRFRADDGRLRLYYGVHNMRWNRLDAAIEQLREAERMLPGDVDVSYNLGLALFQKGQYEESRKYAAQAYDAGFPLPGLRDKLKSVGRW